MTVRLSNALLARSALAAAAVAAALASTPAQAFNRVVVFGDSLSDAGNVAAAGALNAAQVITGNDYVPGAAYLGGTFSNGPIWAQTFASALGLSATASLTGGSNYAWGGARVSGSGGSPSLQQQAQGYLAGTGGVADADTLYVVAGGGNDVRAALTAVMTGTPVPTALGQAAASFASGVGAIVDSLQAAGARSFLVWNVPYVAAAPSVQAAGPAAAGLADAITQAMNAALSAQLAQESGIYRFDLYGWSQSVAANPQRYGFSNGADACGAVVGADCNQYVWWDGLHPTAAAHRVLGAAVLAAAVPEPESWAMMALGLVVAGAAARRRARHAD